MNRMRHYSVLSLLIAGCHSFDPANGPQPVYNVTPAATETTPVDATKSIFPLARYSQESDKWLSPAAVGYNTPVIDAATQQRHFAALKAYYFGTGEKDRSPWNPLYIDKIIATHAARDAINHVADTYLTSSAKSYGLNFRELPQSWKDAVKANITVSITDESAGRSIAVRETLLRALPTSDPAFDDPGRAGQGYPFDNLQVSAIRAGTPLYTLATSKDRAWQYIVSPTLMGWVKSDDVATVDEMFVTRWRGLAQQQLASAVREPVSVATENRFYFIARPGTILPLQQQNGQLRIAVPVKTADGKAEISWVNTEQQDFAPMPLPMTPANIARLIKSMQGKPYGWGQFNFYNDCSAEMRSLMMPFGLFLPRDSSEQAASGRVVDVSKLSPAARLDYLAKNGRPFTTLIHIDGHIMLYIGNTELDGKLVPMTYQNMWGLHTQSHEGRSIVGGSVFFPLLTHYPEDKDLTSLAAKPLFALTFIE